MRLAGADTLPPHLILGADSLAMVRQAEEARAKEAARWEPVTGFINFGAVGQFPELPQG